MHKISSKRDLLVTFIFSVVVASCSLSPKYIKPDLPVARNWHEVSLSEVSSSGDNKEEYIPLEWKKFFKSSTLQSVIQESLNNNRDLRIAVLNIEAAKAAYSIQASNSLPKIDLHLEASRQKIPARISQSGKAVIASQYSANLATTAFELDLFGKVRSLNKAALENYLATEEAHKATKIALIAETANVYLQWLADRRILELVCDTLAAQQRNYDIIKVGHTKGLYSKIDLMQAQTTVETAKANYAQYSRAVAQDKNALILLIGSSNNKFLSSDDSFEKVAIIDSIPASLNSEILLTRPDIKQYEYQLKAQYANIGAARAAFFPTISLTGSYGFASNALGGLFVGGAKTGAWSFAPDISVPIFDVRKSAANLKMVKANQQIAIANYEKAVQTAFREVADALIAYETLAQELKAQTALVQASQDTYDLAWARYKAGIDSHQIALASQQNLFSAQKTLITIQQQQIANFINMYKVLGGGIQ